VVSAICQLKDLLRVIIAQQNWKCSETAHLITTKEIFIDVFPTLTHKT
jgi:hypothetical protein